MQKDAAIPKIAEPQKGTPVLLLQNQAVSGDFFYPGLRVRSCIFFCEFCTRDASAVCLRPVLASRNVFTLSGLLLTWLPRQSAASEDIYLTPERSVGLPAHKVCAV